MLPKKNFKDNLMLIITLLPKINLFLKKEGNHFRLPTLTLQDLSIYIIARLEENKLILLINKFQRLRKSLSNGFSKERVDPIFQNLKKKDKLHIKGMNK